MRKASFFLPSCRFHLPSRVGLLLFMGFISILLAHELARADEFKMTPSVSVKQEYNDNILYSTSDVERGWINTISPALAIKNRTERGEVLVSGRLDYRTYFSEHELNATDQYYEGTGKYAVTSRLNLSGKVLYSRDSRADRDFEISGLTFSNVIRERQNYSASGEYVLSEKMLSTLTYDYLKDRYDSRDYTDLESHTFDLGFIRDLSELISSTRARFDMGFTRYNMPDLKINNYEATLGVEHAMNEKWNLVFNAGGRYTKSDFKIVQLVPAPPFIVQRDESDRGWGAVGQLGLNYKGLNESLTISAAHNIFPGSGTAGTTERTSFTFSLWKRFTYELYGTLSGGYYLNRAKPGEFSRQRIDEDSMAINPGVRYEFDKDKSVEATYSYYRTKYNLSNTTVDRNAIFVRFKIQHELFD